MIEKSKKLSTSVERGSQDLIKPTNLDFYEELKRKWRVSIGAMIIRAYHLEVINYNQYQYLMRKVSERGWRTKEPLFHRRVKADYKNIFA